MSTQVSHSADAYDIIIVGAGGVGSATAYHLAQTGRRILLLEQFAAGHVRGSSHGGSRIIRYTHDTTDYVRQMPETFALWRRLEQEAGAHLMEITGGLYAGPATSSFIQNAQQALTELDFPLRILGPADLRRAYPQFRLPDGWIGFYQEHSGILAASRCVETLATQAVRHGAELRENTRVLAVLPDHGAVTVRVAVPGGEETLHAAQIIITAGPWADLCSNHCCRSRSHSGLHINKSPIFPFSRKISIQLAVLASLFWPTTPTSTAFPSGNVPEP